MSDIDFRATTPPKGGVDFFLTFLRFEFALKENGFCPANGNAKVDWSSVARELGDEFYDLIRESENARTTLERPSKTQICLNHSLDWRNEDPPRNTHQLLEAVRRVRNNLMHGGKSGDPERDQSRSETLIREAQWIVEQALRRMPRVRSSFEGRY